MNKRKYKILLVEDEPGMQKLFEYNLKRAGYECKVAPTGKEGLELAKTFTPDLIVSDIMMPAMNGYEFRKRLLENPHLKKIPFIFLTAKSGEDDILQGYDLEIQDYIVKTSSPKIILAKIASVLKTKEREQQAALKEVQAAAGKMGAKVVPDNAPDFLGFKIKHWHQPFQEIPGGDFIDYIPVDEQNLIVILGDVMGKRWGAWYFAVAYAGYVRSAVRFAIQNGEDFNPSAILRKVNESVYNDERISDVFITLSIALLNNIENTVKYSGAGDLPLILKGKNVTAISSEGLLLGFDENASYEDFELKLSAGNRIFLTTDGIPDSRNPKGESFGLERLKETIKAIPDDADGIEFVKDKFQKFTQGNTDDDISLIEIKII
jgi:sigma-B regulation protein RsbU (phosphoserine phosphatase)